MSAPTVTEPAILGTIGITTGDPAGVGPEIVLQALASGRLPADFLYRVIAGTSAEFVPGHATWASARASWDALEEAAGLVLRGEIAAVATGPVCKHNLYEVGFPYPGQTEFFAARAGVADYAMLLTGGSLTVALVTTHVPLADAARLLSSDEIIRVGHLLAAFVQTRLGGRACRIAVAGLNPHAGERGSLGREEIDLIAPAVAELRHRWEKRSVTVRRTGLARHGVLPSGVRPLGRRAVHVPRPGIDPVEAARVSRGRERDHRTPHHPHQPRPRHGLRDRRTRPARARTA